MIHSNGEAQTGKKATYWKFSSVTSESTCRGNFTSKTAARYRQMGSDKRTEFPQSMIRKSQIPSKTSTCVEIYTLASSKDLADRIEKVPAAENLSNGIIFLESTDQVSN